MRFIDIDHPRCKAWVTTRGAQLLSFVPVVGGASQQDILWCTDETLFREDKPIRGGIPICWPWFGAHSSDPKMPSHGFARMLDWQLVSSERLPECQRLTFELSDSDETRALWPHAFTSRVVMELGTSCKVTLLVNTEGEWIGALHTYLRCEDSAKVRIRGLGSVYQDNLNASDSTTAQATASNFGNNLAYSEAVVSVNSTTERMYVAPEPTTKIAISDTRHLTLTHQGNSDIMLWTPWNNARTSPADMRPEAYKSMLCVETSRIQYPQRSGLMSVDIAVHDAVGV